MLNMNKKNIINILVVLILIFSLYVIIFDRADYEIKYEVENEGTVVFEPDKSLYNHGEEIKVNAIPDEGWEFQSWEGDISGEDNPTFVEIEDDLDIKAIFTPGITRLEVNTYPEDKGTVEISDQTVSSDEFEYGTELKLAPNPREGWQFTGWKGIDTEEYNKIGDQYEIVLDTDRELTALFERKEYDLIFDEDQKYGDIKINPQKDKYYYGDEVKVTALPQEGWQFEGWSRDLSGKDKSTDIVVEDDIFVSADFKPKMVKLDIDITPSNSGYIYLNRNKSFENQFEYGTELELFPEAKSGYEFAYWENDSLENRHKDKEYQLTLERDKQITGVFNIKEFKIDYNIDGKGYLELNPQRNVYEYGDKVQITARPDRNWQFDYWEGDITGRNKNVTVEIKDDIRFTANFNEPEYRQKPVLKRGDQGSSVNELQEILTRKSFLSDEHNTSGVFDLQTLLAVKLLQETHGLEVDGIVGPQTWSVLLSNEGEPEIYTVQSGDTLWGLSRKWNTTTSRIRKLNNLGNPEMIKENQQLKIPGTARLEPESIIPLSWSQVDNRFPEDKTVIITDVETGLHLRVNRLYGTYHADVEPLTREDTSTLRKIYGGEWSWDRRAVVVHLENKKIAGSINGYPHGGETKHNNNFNGHICLHFNGSRLHTSEKMGPEHQQQIKKAENLTWPLID